MSNVTNPNCDPGPIPRQKVFLCVESGLCLQVERLFALRVRLTLQSEEAIINSFSRKPPESSHHLLRQQEFLHKSYAFKYMCFFKKKWDAFQMKLISL